jgi:glutamate synthase (NADPH/NADH) small chain
MTYRTSSAHEEGGERVFAVSTEEFVADADGRLRALRVVDVERVDGRFVPVDGSSREIPAQAAFLAMGFTGPERSGLIDQLGLTCAEGGSVTRNPDYSTDVDGVFIAGDAGRGQSLIVWAIAEGRAAAASVDRYLMGITNLPSPVAATARPLIAN